MRTTLIAAACMMTLAWADAARADDGAASQPEQRVGQQRIQIQVQGGGGGQVRIGGGMVVAGGGGGVSVSSSSGPDGRSIKVSAGGTGSLEYVEDKAGSRHLKICDAEGKSLFDGDVNTPEQRNKVSPEAKALFLELKRHANMPRLGGRMRVAVDGALEPIDRDVVSDNPLDTIFPEDAGAELSRLVGDYRVKVTIKGGKHRLLVGIQDKPVFDGPIDTAQEWAAVKGLPADVIEEAKKMDRNLAAEIAETAPAKPATQPGNN